jgi:hypothetical protein
MVDIAIEMLRAGATFDVVADQFAGFDPILRNPLLLEPA